mgnify:CR=1 FL=1
MEKVLVGHTCLARRVSCLQEHVTVFTDRSGEQGLSAKRPLAIDRSIQLALRHHQNGELQQAAYIYQQILAEDPGQADANHLLGVIAHQVGEDDRAIRLIRTAIGTDPSIEAFHNNLGEAYRCSGQLDRAVASYEAAISIKHDYAEAHANLGSARMGLCQPEMAVICFNQAIAISPDYAEAHCNLGDALSDLGRMEKAISCYNRAIEIHPNYTEAYNNLGNTRRDSGQYDEAIDAYRSALAIQPDCAEIHTNLGSILRDLGQLDQAIASHTKAIAISPDYADAYGNLGAALQDKGQITESIACFRKAVSIDANYADGHSNLGVALLESMQMGEAVASFRKALSIRPDYAPAHSNLLFASNYRSGLPQEDAYAEYQRWNERHAKPLLPTTHSYTNSREAARKLRIGYISPDFKTHSVAYFFEPLLTQHSRAKYEIYCYSNVKNPDAVTDRLRRSSDHWCSIVGKSDDSAADQIRHDQIDILVDLAGHTENNRLLVLARKPAPVQVTWLGYPNTTGLESVDYRFTDEIADPVGLSDQFYSEELVRLPNGFLSYQGIESASSTSVPPCLECGHVTFGSFNNLTKVTHEVVSLWIEILRVVPDAHLLLKSKSLADTGVRERFLDMFSEGQISRDRIDLHSHMPSLQHHLHLYSQVDIGLDPFPYNGTTTTCEALWMGVPVVTLLGDRHAGRVGASLMNRVGLHQLIAADQRSYLDAAAGLAEDTDTLASLRRSLREGMRKSELCNATGFARTVEGAYSSMWKTYLANS